MHARREAIAPEAHRHLALDTRPPVLGERHRRLPVVHPAGIERAGARMFDPKIALHDRGGAPDLTAADITDRAAEPIVERRLDEIGVFQRSGTKRRRQDRHTLSALPRRDEDRRRLLDRLGHHWHRAPVSIRNLTYL